MRIPFRHVAVPRRHRPAARVPRKVSPGQCCLSRVNVLLVVALFGSQPEPARAQALPRAEPDDQRAPAGPFIQATAADTVYVAPPTGDETDRASILAALAQAGPGDVIQFAPGIYVVGEIIPIETAELTILGHGDGTTLRGCDPGAYEWMLDGT